MKRIKVFRLCTCCGNPFYKNKNMNHTQFKKQRTCSSKCGGIQLSHSDYLKQKLKYVLSNTVTTPTGCIEYQGYLINTGYGSIKLFGKARQVHRFIWEQLNGEIPEGLFVCHHCDNPPCINLEHLFLGTNQDNMDDKVRKGRQRQFIKLNKQIINQIVQMAKEGILYKDIAKEFLISSNWARVIANKNGIFRKGA